MGRGAKALLITLIILVIVFSAIGISYYYNEKYLYKLDYFNEVKEAASTFNVDIYLIYAIIKVESSFNESSVSVAGAIGLMQIMPDTAEYLLGHPITEDYLYNPINNINIGVKYLKYLSEKFSDINWQIIAYNAGETKARQWQADNIAIENVPYEETRNYVQKVTKTMERYRELYYLY